MLGQRRCVAEVSIYKDGLLGRVEDESFECLVGSVLSPDQNNFQKGIDVFCEIRRMRPSPAAASESGD